MSASFVSPDVIRRLFAQAMSRMYRTEVPLYGTLVELVERINTEVLAQDPALARYVNQSAAHQWARRMEHLLEKAPPGLSLLPRLTAWDSPFNPVRPLPPVGGSPLLHGVEGLGPVHPHLYHRIVVVQVTVDHGEQPTVAGLLLGLPQQLGILCLCSI